MLPYSGTGDAVARMLRAEGPGSFFRGFGAVLAVSPVANALYFSAYESVKVRLKDTAVERVLGPTGVVIIGGLVAQSAAGLAYTPQDVVKERLQVQRIAARPAWGNIPATTLYHGSWDAARSILRAEGMKGLFRGYWAQNAAWWPWNVLYFATYEHMRSSWATHLGLGSVDGLEPVHSALAATAAAAAATVATNPVDVVKTRLQALPHGRGATSAWSIARAMMTLEGPGAFAAGMGARVLSIAPGACITFGCFEAIKRALM